uniref:Uncharacterized protein n=1 Tax=Romanomermis culicivorax TaxID=13658 RepID=A0A915J817_ROMCU
MRAGNKVSDTCKKVTMVEFVFPSVLVLDNGSMTKQSKGRLFESFANGRRGENFVATFRKVSNEQLVEGHLLCITEATLDVGKECQLEGKETGK